MSASKTLALSFLLAFAEARFGQEQIPVAAISALSSFGSPGQAGTLSGSVPGVLLAAANPCAKLQLADKIVDTLGSDPQVISAAAQLVAAERNFNPFVVSVDSFCASPDLPATAELRGILPLVDPSVTGADTENANSKTSLTSPFDANGLSVAEIAIAQGFSNFTAVDSTGAKVQLSGLAAGSGSGAGGAAKNGGANSGAASSGSANSAAPTTLLTATRAASSASACTPVTVTVTSTPAASATGGANNNNNGAASSTAAAAAPAGTGAASSGAVAGKGAGDGVKTTLSGADFGSCNPTIRREGGLNGRKATELTFQSNDPKIEKIQQEALNPNIITNRICDELTNQCGANAAAKSACLAAKAKVSAIGSPADRADATVTVWNSALGF